MIFLLQKLKQNGNYNELSDLSCTLKYFWRNFLYEKNDEKLRECLLEAMALNDGMLEEEMKNVEPHVLKKSLKAIWSNWLSSLGKESFRVEKR